MPPSEIQEMPLLDVIEPSAGDKKLDNVCILMT